MSHSFRQVVNFEQWSELAIQDPAAFEARRRELIEALIGSSPKRCRPRLRGLQWRIDQVRDHSPTPMAACISLSNMMWEAFAGEDGLVQTLNSRHILLDRPAEKAQLLPFRERRK